MADKSQIVKIMVDGELTDALVRVDGNGEFAVYTKAGRTFFFPAGCDLKAEIKKHNEVNGVKPILAEDAPPLVDEELEAWLAGDTPAEPAETPSAEEAEEPAAE